LGAGGSERPFVEELVLLNVSQVFGRSDAKDPSPGAVHARKLKIDQ
jgi:hypothetical protein